LSRSDNPLFSNVQLIFKHYKIKHSARQNKIDYVLNNLQLRRLP
jgi:hypothetical protein